MATAVQLVFRFEVIAMADQAVDELIETFGVSDGHIDYQAFVKIMIEGTGDTAPRPAA